MNLSMFILTGYKIWGKKQQLSQHQISEISLKTSEMVTLMHIILVCTLGKSQLCDV